MKVNSFVIGVCFSVLGFSQICYAGGGQSTLADDSQDETLERQVSVYKRENYDPRDGGGGFCGLGSGASLFLTWLAPNSDQGLVPYSASTLATPPVPSPPFVEEIKTCPLVQALQKETSKNNLQFAINIIGESVEIISENLIKIIVYNNLSAVDPNNTEVQTIIKSPQMSQNGVLRGVKFVKESLQHHGNIHKCTKEADALINILENKKIILTDNKYLKIRTDPDLTTKRVTLLYQEPGGEVYFWKIPKSWDTNRN